MIFLSAQPDDFYFLWQLELQIHNFRSLGIAPSDIHILIGYNSQNGLAQHFDDFIKDHRNEASFFVYPDQRNRKGYIPSLRPNIIRQHFKKHPQLSKECIFYHDSDILFRELPNFDLLCHTATWYVSDTRTYLDSKYIIRSANKRLLSQMCQIVGIASETVVANDEHVGGAQYLLKHATVEFWEKIENDSEDLYQLLRDYNYKMAENEYIGSKQLRSKKPKIQAWCADMWAMLWNAWLKGHHVEIAKELDFSWAVNHIQQWHEKKILHYTGGVAKDDLSNFQKSRYTKASPFYDPSLKLLAKEYCGYPVKEAIDKMLAIKPKFDCSDVTFILEYNAEKQHLSQNLVLAVRYLSKNLKTNILIVETGQQETLNYATLKENGCEYIFIEDSYTDQERKIIHDYLLLKIKTRYVSFYDPNLIVPIGQIIESVHYMRQGCAFVSPFSEVTKIDMLLRECFTRILDSDFLELNKGKGQPANEIEIAPYFLHKEELAKISPETDDIFCRTHIHRLDSFAHSHVKLEGNCFNLTH